MHLWAEYLQDISDEKEIDAYFTSAQAETNFTDFYFITREGNYLTITGVKGYLDLDIEMTEVILNGRDAVVNSVVPGKPQIMVFVTPAQKGTYKGFEYEAIAVSYNNSDIVNALQISAFDGNASSFVVHSDGRVVVDNAAEKQNDIYNLRQYRIIIVVRLRSQIFRQIVQKRRRRADARQGTFVQDDGKYASKRAAKAAAVNCAVLP